MMNNIEDFQNLIELLKKALEFYANSSNYESHTENASMIDLDEHGSQARFALSKIEEMKVNNQKILDDYANISEKMLGEMENNIVNTNIQDLFKTINEINDENNNI